MQRVEMAKVAALVSVGQSREFTDVDMDVWFDLLGDLDGALAYDATRDLLRNTDKFITPSDIRGRCNSLAKERLARVGVPTAPPGLSVPEYREWMRTYRAAAVSGCEAAGAVADANRQIGRAGDDETVAPRDLNFDVLRRVDDDVVDGEVVGN